MQNAEPSAPPAGNTASTSPPAAVAVESERGGRRLVAEYVRAAAIVTFATGAAGAARALLHVPDVEMLFLLGVMIVAMTSARGPSLLASILSVGAYDFFFVPPFYTFAVEDVRYLLTFGTMLGIGLVVSTLALRVREQEQAQAAVEREQRTAALYAVSRQLGAALGVRDVAAVCAGAAADVLGAASVLLVGPGVDELAPAPPGDAPAPEELAVARWAFLHGSAAGRGTGTFDESPVLCIPLRPVVDVLAVLVIRLPGGRALREDRRAFADALCRQGALALERVRLAEEARRAALRAEAEELRSGLLSSVSHDLRTPLAAITGAATTLRDGGELDAGTRRELVEAVCDEAERLERLVRNLLDMTRLESGSVEPKREWVPLVELVGGALTRLEHTLSGRTVRTELPDDLPLLSVDPVLVEQLFLNVLENAAKYTPPASPITISAATGDGSVVVEIADRGPGIPAGAEEQIFERFRRGGSPAVAGVGLGLAVARAIARAHGGTLTAANRADGGAAFRLRIPAAEPPGAGGTP